MNSTFNPKVETIKIFLAFNIYFLSAETFQNHCSACMDVFEHIGVRQRHHPCGV